jgi:exosome complex exonuclease RRP6
MDGLNTMLEELKSVQELAIDLEHHDVHSYHGIVSLMQISTRDKDWVIDTLKPWREELQRLNEVFTDPKILKVLHGSSMDIIWLQRDLGLYVVGMFDTYHAAVALGYPKRSLKFLLEEFTKLRADKRYQVADWRIRPLPSGMFDYARSDTHYLLYIYDHLRNQLIEQSTPQQRLVNHVLEQSRAEALQRYERPVYDAKSGQCPGGWYDFLTRSSITLSKEQFAVFKAVHQWRDQIARIEDEGVQCVLSRNALIRLAQTMPLDHATLFRTISTVTPIVKDRVSDLLEVIKAAKIAGANGPEWRDVAKPTRATAEGPRASSKAVVETIRLKQGQLTPPGETETVPQTGSRLQASRFWGSMLPHHEVSAPAEHSVAACTEALRLSLPLPPVQIVVSEVRETPGNNAADKPGSLSQLVASAGPPKNEIFTVKEIGSRGKRKATDQEDGANPLSLVVKTSTQNLNPDANVVEQPIKKPYSESVNGKTSTVALQPRRQRAPGPETTPFDYATAASVLHAGPDLKPGRSFPQPSTQPFNPYAKALSAPQAGYKPNRDSGGKSFTFRK